MDYNKNYWDLFYKKSPSLKPSSFAKFLVLKNIKKKPLLLDIGCGNGRDTFFFIKNNFKCIAVDISKKAICENNKKLKNIFFNFDFCKNNFIKKSKIKGKFDYIYARFFIHTIDLKYEAAFLRNVKKISSKKTKIFLEFRTINDPFYKNGNKISKYERVTDHYRRFIDHKEFIKRCETTGFKVTFCKLGYNFANYKGEKPHICRIILVKI